MKSHLVDLTTTEILKIKFHVSALEMSVTLRGEGAEITSVDNVSEGLFCGYVGRRVGFQSGEWRTSIGMARWWSVV